MVAALLTAAVIAAAPPGFYESRVLEPAASYVAGKPATVYCAATVGDWRTYAEREASTLAANGLTYVGSSESALAASVCAPLRQELRHKHVKTAVLADAMLALTHEAVHQSGVRDESETDCHALALLPTVAHRFFGFAYHRGPLRALVAAAWKAHREKPAVFRSSC